MKYRIHDCETTTIVNEKGEIANCERGFGNQQENTRLIKDALNNNEMLLPLLFRLETEMRYAGWNKQESDNVGRNETYLEVKAFIELIEEQKL